MRRHSGNYLLREFSIVCVCWKLFDTPEITSPISRYSENVWVLSCKLSWTLIRFIYMQSEILTGCNPNSALTFSNIPWPPYIFNSRQHYMDVFVFLRNVCCISTFRPLLTQVRHSDFFRPDWCVWRRFFFSSTIFVACFLRMLVREIVWVIIAVSVWLSLHENTGRSGERAWVLAEGI